MKRLLTSLSLLCLLLAGGCGTTDKRDAQNMYDLGPGAPLQAVTGPHLPAVAVGEITAPTWMDSSRMVYRLDYDNPLEARSYAQARWTMSPSRLFLQRLKAGLAQSGTAVISTSDGARDLPTLRIDADDFSQVFKSASVSQGRVQLRASLLQDRKLVAQKSFSFSAPAPSADAPGGVKALADASDAVIRDMIVWLNSLNLPR